MAKKNIAQEVQARIHEMQESKAAQLKEIQDKQTEAQTQKEAAALAMKDATERMDLDAYEEAKQAKHKAQTALDMYSGRYTQIKQQEYISEKESDEVIASLLAYEKQLAEDFKAAASPHLLALKEILQEYKGAVQDTENTINTWHREIHANYLSQTTTYAETGTNRSPNPIPVHTTPYTGCSEAHRLNEYLKNAEII